MDVEGNQAYGERQKPKGNMKNEALAYLAQEVEGGVKMNNIWKIEGEHAIRIAERDGVRLRKYADPTEGYRDRVSLDDARAIARVDPSLIYCVVEHVGWTGPGLYDGYRVEDYFPGSLCGTARSGARYAGPDEDGVEPTWRDA